MSTSTLPGLAEQYVNDPAGVQDFVLRNIGTREDNDGNVIIWDKELKQGSLGRSDAAEIAAPGPNR